jgi:fructokinase
VQKMRCFDKLSTNGTKQTMQTPIVIFGEVLMDCIVQPNHSFIPYEGGSPYNVARAIALQGGAVTFANPISTDELGARLKNTLLADGVSLGMAQNNLPTSLAMVSFVDGQPSYQFYREGVADRSFTAEQALTYLAGFAKPGILHTGSLALVPPEAEKTLVIIEAAKQLGWTISMDINLRPRLARDMTEYRQTLLTAIRHADWLKASDEDLQTLLIDGVTMGGIVAADVSFANASRIAAAIATLGCNCIALTFGGDGALLQVGKRCVQAPAPKVNVIDTVGCGDTFWGTCVLAWAQGEVNVETTLQRALKAAAINATRAGCKPSTAAELL